MVYFYGSSYPSARARVGGASTEKKTEKAQTTQFYQYRIRTDLKRTAAIAGRAGAIPSP